MTLPPMPQTPATLEQTLCAVADGSPCVTLHGLSGSSSALMIARITASVQRQTLIITPDQASADELYRELQYFHADQTLAFPAWDLTPFEDSSPAADISGARLETLQRLSSGGFCTVVAPITAVLQRVLPRQLLCSASCCLQPGDEPDRELLLEQLVRMGYQNCQLVEERGSFAIRGGILDVFPPGLTMPVRIEFFGDTIETLRSFDPLTQRSREPLEQLLLLPSRELLLTPETLQTFVPRLKERADQLDLPADHRRSLINNLQLSGYPPGIEFLQPLLHPQLETIFDYLNSPLLILNEPDRLATANSRFREELAAAIPRVTAEHRLFPEPEQLYLNTTELTRQLASGQRIELSELPTAGHETERQTFSFLTHTNQDLRIHTGREQQHLLGPLVERLQGWLKNDWRCLVVCHQQTQAERLQELFAPYGIPCRLIIGYPDEQSQAEGAGTLLISIGELSRGFRIPEARLAVIAEEELFGKRTRRKSGISTLRTKQILASLAELKPGDAMVHVDHGIGIYRGLQHLKTGTIEGDFLLLEYAGNDKLYLPIDRLALVQRYSGGEGATPSPAKLGGQVWEKTRSRARKNIE